MSPNTEIQMYVRIRLKALNEIEARLSRISGHDPQKALHNLNTEDLIVGLNSLVADLIADDALDLSLDSDAAVKIIEMEFKVNNDLA